jgi:hypothetical protein
VHLASGFWSRGEQLDDSERDLLSVPFSKKDLALAVHRMKTESASGPNGFTVTFFKKLWMVIKDDIMKMVLNFNKDVMDLRRLNYGVITLVLKLKKQTVSSSTCPSAS